MLQVLHLDVSKVDRVLQIISLPPCLQLPRLGVSTFSRRRLGIRTRGVGGRAPSPSSLCWRRVMGWRRGREWTAASSTSGCSFYSVILLRGRVGAPSVTLFCGSIAEIGRLLSIERVGATSRCILGPDVWTLVIPFFCPKGVWMRRSCQLDYKPLRCFDRALAGKIKLACAKVTLNL
jgi:hypothetical protein